jgi:hypothetical protein
VRARTKPVIPVYYDYLNDEEAGTTAIKADGSTKIVTVKTSEWFETHETIKDGGASPKAPKATDSAAPVKRARRTKAQKEADDRAAAAAKSIASNGHPVAPHAVPVAEAESESAPDLEPEMAGSAAE